MKIDSIINRIVSEMQSHKTTTTATLSSYRRDMAAATEQAAMYKNESEELTRRKAILIAEARCKIEAADKKLSVAVKAAIPQLRKELAVYFGKPANPELLSQLKTYRDFGLKMTRTELDSFITAAEGNHVALKIIREIAADSGFSVTIPDGFEDDLKKVERLAQVPTMWCDPAYLHEGLEVLPDCPHFNDSGELAYSAGRPDSIYLIIRSGGFKSACEHLEAMGQKWGTAFVPEVTELKPATDSSGKTVSPEDQHAEAVADAADMVDVHPNVPEIKADNSGRDVLQHYI